MCVRARARETGQFGQLKKRERVCAKCEFKFSTFSAYNVCLSFGIVVFVDFALVSCCCIQCNINVIRAHTTCNRQSTVRAKKRNTRNERKKIPHKQNDYCNNRNGVLVNWFLLRWCTCNRLHVCLKK